MESQSSPECVTFAALQTRLIHHVNGRIQNGDFTERGLARILGVSQPQLHNVLKGARKLQPELADQLLEKLGMSLTDLLQTSEITNQLSRRYPAGAERLDLVMAIAPRPNGDSTDPRLELIRKPPVRAVANTLPFHKQAS